MSLVPSIGAMAAMRAAAKTAAVFPGGVPTLAQWKSTSSAGWFCGRTNQALLAVDERVGAYETLMRGRPTAQARFDALMGLLEAVEGYLASKGGVHRGPR